MTVRFYRSLSLRMNNYAPQLIVKTPSPWHALATQNSAAQTPCHHLTNHYLTAGRALEDVK